MPRPFPRLLLISILMAWLIMMVSPANANEAQLHILNAGINLGWAKATLDFRGDRNPTDAENIAAALRAAAEEIQAAEALFQEPFRTQRARSNVAGRLIVKIQDYFKRAPRMSIPQKASYVMNLWGVYRQGFQTTYRSRPDGVHYQPNCDFFILDAGYHFGRAHIAAGVSTSRARSYQNGAISDMRQAIRGGLSVAIDGYTQAQTNARKVCCSFGTVATWKSLPNFKPNSPHSLFARSLSTIQSIVRNAVLPAGRCGGCSKGCKKIVGVWRWNGGELHVCPIGGRLLFRTARGRLEQVGHWKCLDDCKGRIRFDFHRPRRRRLDVRITGNGLSLLNPQGNILSGKLRARPDCRRIEPPSRLLSGRWSGNRGGTFVVTQEGNRISWRAEGIYQGKKWSHKGSGTLTGRKISGRFEDLPGSAFYPKSRDVSGTVSADGNKITWKGMEPVWTRGAGGGGVPGGEKCVWKKGSTIFPSACMCKNAQGVTYTAPHSRCGH